jgi:uncharacterized membrane-anchored protein YhcB (DUF1043 family)
VLGGLTGFGLGWVAVNVGWVFGLCLGLAAGYGVTTTVKQRRALIAELKELRDAVDR